MNIQPLLAQDSIKRDFIGRELKVNDYVITTINNHLFLGKIIKLNQVQIKLEIKHKTVIITKHKYPTDVVKISNADMTFYLLR